jgi:hypothetical protein
MQAEVDGRGLAEVARVPKQPFIEPAQLSAGQSPGPIRIHSS